MVIVQNVDIDGSKKIEGGKRIDSSKCIGWYLEVLCQDISRAFIKRLKRPVSLAGEPVNKKALWEELLEDLVSPLNNCIHMPLHILFWEVGMNTYILFPRPIP